MKKQLKDTEVKYKIKLSILQKHFKDETSYSNIPYKYLVEIDKESSKISTLFAYTKKGTKELLKFIKEECWLK